MLLDDRDERAGVKFKDADLIGIPLRVTIGRKSLEQGKVEIVRRKTAQIRAASTCEGRRPPIAEAVLEERAFSPGM